MEPAKLLTTTLRDLAWGQTATEILAAALGAVEPGNAVRRWLRRDGATLTLGEARLTLPPGGRIFCVALGKASVPMAVAARDIAGDLLAGGVAITKHGYLADAPELGANWTVIAAGHPVPDDQSVAGARAISAALGTVTERDLVLALVSGGGSALMTLPAPGVSLADLRELTGVLLGCGATINEINTLRKHLDQVKGGGLATLAAPATLWTLILSDVVGNPLDVIASGPTVPDPSTYADCLAILARHAITERVPPATLAHLRQGAAGAIPETLKPGDPRLRRVVNVIVGDNAQAAEAAQRRAIAAGFNTMILTTYLQGEAREAGRMMAAVLRELRASDRPLRRPACVLIGGETTVTLRGAGRGGRNQELALSAVAELAGLDDALLIALATDGGDGPTDAAGAVVNGATLARAQAAGLDPAAYLARNDAYPFFAALGDLLLPGPTQTNVNDLALLFAW